MGFPFGVRTRHQEMTSADRTRKSHEIMAPQSTGNLRKSTAAAFDFHGAFRGASPFRLCAIIARS